MCCNARAPSVRLWARHPTLAGITYGSLGSTVQVRTYVTLLFVLQEAYEECVAKGHTITRIEQAITGPGASRPHSLPTTTTIHRRFPAALAGLLRRGEHYTSQRDTCGPDGTSLSSRE